MEDLIAIIAIVCIFGLPVIAGIILGMRAIKSRNDERMGLINQGIIPPRHSKKRKQPPQQARVTQERDCACCSWNRDNCRIPMLRIPGNRRRE